MSAALCDSDADGATDRPAIHSELGGSGPGQFTASSSIRRHLPRLACRWPAPTVGYEATPGLLDPSRPTFNKPLVRFS